VCGWQVGSYMVNVNAHAMWRVRSRSVRKWENTPKTRRKACFWCRQRPDVTNMPERACSLRSGRCRRTRERENATEHAIWRVRSRLGAKCTKLIAKRDKRTQMGAFVVSGSHGRRGEAQTRTNTPYGVFIMSVDRERVVFVRGWLQRKARHHESAQTGAFVVSGLSVCVEKRWGGLDPPRCLPRHVSKQNRKKEKKAAHLCARCSPPRSCQKTVWEGSPLPVRVEKRRGGLKAPAFSCRKWRGGTQPSLFSATSRQ